MRPTIQEQLDQSARLLETLVMPAVAERMSRVILEGVIENLKLLRSALPKIKGFFVWDNEAMICLLRDLGQHSAIDGGLENAELASGSTSDCEEVENEALRKRLADIICSLDADDARLAAIRQHLIERASRFPLRSIPATPGGTAGSAL